MAVDPVPLKGEKRDAPKVINYPVTEETPVFRDFHISNVVCDGARRAIFIRGLPEMNISDIFLDNMVIQAKAGVEIEEAKNVQQKNVRIVLDADKK
jgi:hypothetical protein